MENIKQFIINNDVEFMYGDISNLDICRKAVRNIDMICHQAAIGSVPRSVDDPLTSHIANVNGFLNILIAAKENNIKRIVYASSSSVYGDNNNLPKEESKVGNVLSPYAATKKIDEIYADVFTKCYNMEIIGLRYFNIFGPRQDPNGMYAAVIPKFIDMIKNNKSPVINGDGSYSRDFTYVDNAVLANYLALITTNKDSFGKAFNIGTGGNISIIELFNTIKKLLDSHIEPIFGDNRKGDINHSHANINLAKEILNYEPIVSFDEGIKKLLIFNGLF
jgi:UDP-N-acetylglucosamine 4-epimerase